MKAYKVGVREFTTLERAVCFTTMRRLKGADIYNHKIGLLRWFSLKLIGA